MREARVLGKVKVVVAGSYEIVLCPLLLCSAAVTHRAKTY
jgi:hypothetical protein